MLKNKTSRTKPYLKELKQKFQRQRVSERLYRSSIAGGLHPSISLLDDLIQFLNEAHTEKGRCIITILEQMLAIEQMAKPVNGTALPALELQRTDPERFKLLCEIDDKVSLLRKDLEKFKFVPHAEVAVGGNGGAAEWVTWWHAGYDEQREPRLGKPKRGLRLRRDQTLEDTLRMRPSEALEAILRLTHIGSLSRLRRCAHCGTWVYAKFSHQNFCSLGCQQKHYTQTPQWKAHRSAYMRRYYQKNFKRQ